MALLDDILGKIVDIKLEVQPDQLCVVNVKTEDKAFNYIIEIPPKPARAFADAIITPEIQKEIKQLVRKNLESIFPTLEKVSDLAATEVVTAATSLWTEKIIKIKLVEISQREGTYLRL